MGGGVGVQDLWREGCAAPVTDGDTKGCTRRIRVSPCSSVLLPLGAQRHPNPEITLRGSQIANTPT